MIEKTSMLHKLKEGQVYMETWPMRKELVSLFPEHRIITATRFGIKVMPAVAAISVLTQLSFHNANGLPQAIIIALFALSLPIQGFWWLGNRSKTQLPPSLVVWYREIHQKIADTGAALEPPKNKPRYKELAQLLNRAFRQLDKNALERWF